MALFNTRSNGWFHMHDGIIHSIMVCTKEEYDAFCREEMVWNAGEGRLVDLKTVGRDWVENGYVTYQSWSEICEGDTYKLDYTTPIGEQIVIFGDCAYFPWISNDDD